MPPKKKFRSVRSKKMKFTGNMYTQQPDSQQSMATVADSSTDVSEVTEMPSESCMFFESCMFIFECFYECCR